MWEEKQLRELAELLMKYFVNDLGRWIDILPIPNPKKHLRSITLEDIEKHLLGSVSINLTPIDKNGKARWICIDIDDFEEGKKVYQILQRLKVSLVPERTVGDNDGWHFWILFKPTEYGRVYSLASIFKKLLEKLGISRIEVFPKSKEIDREGFGSCVRLPLGKNQKTKAFTFLANEQGDEVDPLVFLRSLQLNDFEEIEKTIRQEYDRIWVQDYEYKYNIKDIITLKNEEKELEWLINPLIPRGCLVILGGRPKVGKSFLALHIGREVSHGGKFLDYASCKQGSILYIDEDMDEYTEALRAKKINPADLFGRNFKIASWSEIRQEVFRLDDEKCLRELERYIRLANLSLVIIDNLETTLGGIDLIKEADLVNKILVKLRRIAVKTNCTILIIHHSRKPKETSTHWRYEYKGSLVITGRADVLMFLDYDEKRGVHKLYVESRFLEEDICLAYEMFHNEDGTLNFEFRGFIKEEYVVDKAREAILNWIKEENAKEFWMKEVIEKFSSIASRETIRRALRLLEHFGYLEKEEVKGLTREEIKEHGKVKFKVLKLDELEENEKNASL